MCFGGCGPIRLRREPVDAPVALNERRESLTGAEEVPSWYYSVAVGVRVRFVVVRCCDYLSDYLCDIIVTMSGGDCVEGALGNAEG